MEDAEAEVFNDYPDDVKMCIVSSVENADYFKWHLANTSIH